MNQIPEIAGVETKAWTDWEKVRVLSTEVLPMSEDYYADRGFECGLNWPDKYEGTRPKGPLVYEGPDKELVKRSKLENLAWLQGWDNGHNEKLRRGLWFLNQVKASSSSKSNGFPTWWGNKSLQGQMEYIKLHPRTKMYVTRGPDPSRARPTVRTSIYTGRVLGSWARRSHTAQQQYLKDHPRSRKSLTRGYWEAKTPSQQMEYLQKHPRSKKTITGVSRTF